MHTTTVRFLSTGVVLKMLSPAQSLGTSCVENPSWRSIRQAANEAKLSCQTNYGWKSATSVTKLCPTSED